jgi:hypothetical protein
MVDMHSKYNFYNGTINDSSDYQRQYLFRAIFTGSTDMITYLISSTATPVEATEEIKVEWMNSNVKVGGRTQYNDWSVTCRDTINGTAYDFFSKWKKKVYDRSTGTSQVPGGYKEEINLELLDNNGAPTKTFRLIGAFPKSIGESTTEYASEGLLTFQVTFAFDLFDTNNY